MYDRDLETMGQNRDEFHQSRGRAATCKVCFGQALPRFSQQSIHTSFDDDYSTNPKPIPLEAHAPPQHLILNVHNSTVPEIPCVLSVVEICGTSTGTVGDRVDYRYVPVSIL